MSKFFVFVSLLSYALFRCVHYQIQISSTPKPITDTGVARSSIVVTVLFNGSHISPSRLLSILSYIQLLIGAPLHEPPRIVNESRLASRTFLISCTRVVQAASWYPDVKQRESGIKMPHRISRRDARHIRSMPAWCCGRSF